MLGLRQKEFPQDWKSIIQASPFTPTNTSLGNASYTLLLKINRKRKLLRFILNMVQATLSRRNISGKKTPLSVEQKKKMISEHLKYEIGMLNYTDTILRCPSILTLHDNVKMRLLSHFVFTRAILSSFLQIQPMSRHQVAMLDANILAIKIIRILL